MLTPRGLCQGAASGGLPGPRTFGPVAPSAHPLRGVTRSRGGCRPLVPVSVCGSAGFSERALHPGVSGAGDRDPRRVRAPGAAVLPGWAPRWRGPEGAGPRAAAAPPARFPVRHPPWWEQDGKVHRRCALRSGAPVAERLASSRHLRNFPGRRRREMAAWAPLAWSHTAICWPPRSTAALAAAPELRRHRRGPGAPLPEPARPGPGGRGGQGGLRGSGICAAERAVPIKESCFRNRFIGGRQSQQMKGLWWKILIGAGQL